MMMRFTDHLRSGSRVVSVFFFKQKTAYDMRISDWSSDVCSSDLADAALDQLLDGTGYVPRRDASGAVIIVKGEQHAQAAPRPVAPPPPPPPAPAEPETTELQAVQVTEIGRAHV